jgi:hypothetical protein
MATQTEPYKITADRYTRDRLGDLAQVLEEDPHTMKSLADMGVRELVIRVGGSGEKPFPKAWPTDFLEGQPLQVRLHEGHGDNRAGMGNPYVDVTLEKEQLSHIRPVDLERAFYKSDLVVSAFVRDPGKHSADLAGSEARRQVEI